MHCACLRGRDPDHDGFTFNTELDLWVHVECGLPTEAYANAMTLKELL